MSELLNAKAWETMSTIGFILSGVFLAVAVFIFVYYKIHLVISDLTGRTAQNQIREIRERNAGTNKKAFKPSKVNMKRGTLTDRVKQTGQITNGSSRTEIIPHPSAKLGGNSGSDDTTMGLSGVLPTDLLSNNNTGMMTDLLQKTSTTPLTQDFGPKTDVLPMPGMQPASFAPGVQPAAYATEVLPQANVELYPPSYATEVLPPADATTPLQTTGELSKKPVKTASKEIEDGFTIVKSIVEIHTDKVIQ